MAAEGRCRTDLAVAPHRREHGVGFPRPGYDHRDHRGLQQRRDGQGEGMGGHVLDLLEAAVMNLLAAAGLIEPDHLDQNRIEEVGDRRVVEGQVTVLADPARRCRPVRPAAWLRNRGRFAAAGPGRPPGSSRAGPDRALPGETDVPEGNAETTRGGRPTVPDTRPCESRQRATSRSSWPATSPARICSWLGAAAKIDIGLRRCLLEIANGFADCLSGRPPRPGAILENQNLEGLNRESCIRLEFGGAHQWVPASVRRRRSGLATFPVLVRHRSKLSETTTHRHREVTHAAVVSGRLQDDGRTGPG